MYGIWAIVALAGTLAGELAGGSLDVVASTPLVRRRLAIEKVLAYLALLAVSVLAHRPRHVRRDERVRDAPR